MPRDYIKAAITPISDEDLETRIALAKDPNTSPRILADLANDQDSVVQLCLRLNPNSSIYTGNVCYGVDIAEDDPDYWGFDEWMYRVGADYHLCDDAVVLDFNYPSNGLYSAPWWIDTIERLSALDFTCSDEQQFIEVNQDKEDVSDLSELYSAHRKYQVYRRRDFSRVDSDLNLNVVKFLYEALRIFYPEINFAFVEMHNPSNPESTAVCIYDSDALNLNVDNMASYYYWDVYEIRSWCLTTSELSDLSVKDLAEAGDAYTVFGGDGAIDPERDYIIGKQYRENIKYGDFIDNLAAYLNLPVEQIMLV